MQFAVFLASGSVPQGYNDWFALWTVGASNYDPRPRESAPLDSPMYFPDVPPGPGSIQLLLRVVDRATLQVLFESGWLRSHLITPDDASSWEFNATSGVFRQVLPIADPREMSPTRSPAQARGLNVQYAKVQVSSG